jgi:pyruvate/2-oxoglutarate dehydrogenase complex dihydrolipoamide dehydrogenase (E3) component
MAANDGPVPVRTLAHAARLIRDARQLGRYGIGVSEPSLDYPRLLARVEAFLTEARSSQALMVNAMHWFKHSLSPEMFRDGKT